MSNPILDDQTQLPSVRTPVTMVIEFVLVVIGFVFIVFCLNSAYEAGFVLSESFEEFILATLGGIALFYVYKWRQLSKQYEARQLQISDIPKRFYILRFLVGGSGIFISAISLLSFSENIMPGISPFVQLEFLLTHLLLLSFGFSLIFHSIISKNLKKILNTTNIR